MADFSDFELGKSARRLRVDTLARLRWLAIFGQLAAICFTEFALKFSLPLVWCLAVIAASALFNLGQKFFAAPTLRLADGPAAAQLAFDILQLSALLYLTGGLENPFAVLFLAPVAIAAMSLPPRKIAYLGLLTAAAATVLGFEHRPLPWFPGEAISLPQLYQAGVWTAILVSSRVYLRLCGARRRRGAGLDGCFERNRTGAPAGKTPVPARRTGRRRRA